MAANLTELGVKLEQQTERIISGLKDRSRYLLNKGIYEQEFCDGKTLFDYRLLREQSLDAEFGRFDFSYQHPILFEKEELPASKRKRPAEKEDVIPVRFSIGKDVILAYRNFLSNICNPGEDESTYGEVTKLDVSNVLTLYERICGLGSEVAATKLHEYPGLICEDSQEKILRVIRRRDIEDKRVITTVELARKYNLPNPESIGGLFRDLIDFTIKAELECIQKVREIEQNKPRQPVGWGQVPSTNIPPFVSATRGFGSA